MVAMVLSVKRLLMAVGESDPGRSQAPELRFNRMYFELFFGVLTSISSNYWTDVFRRLLARFSTGIVGNRALVLATELVNPTKRGRFGWKALGIGTHSMQYVFYWRTGLPYTDMKVESSATAEWYKNKEDLENHRMSPITVEHDSRK
ncbi:hypothetical protein L2E82_19846 [Cichorium intybus]|uniref:Uncharacterized protein n=1 Tax=Cichorium intybus TaxID=13427 RepID=A0ACB9DRF3_CICIN|nr:hypothetical protein L2E82_19846 [Cichorium intybus]